MTGGHCNPPLLKLTAAVLLKRSGKDAGTILAALKSDAQRGAQRPS
jgi:hypothetical protein